MIAARSEVFICFAFGCMIEPTSILLLACFHGGVSLCPKKMYIFVQIFTKKVLFKVLCKYSWWKKSCTTCNAQKGFDIGIKNAFGAQVQDFFHQQYHLQQTSEWASWSIVKRMVNIQDYMYKIVARYEGLSDCWYQQWLSIIPNKHTQVTSAPVVLATLGNGGPCHGCGVVVAGTVIK